MKSKVVRNLVGRVLIIRLGAVLFLSATAMGQGWSPTDNGKNAAFVLPQAWGTDEVNLYNGRVALNIPLGTIGGRGEAAYQPTVSISRTFVMRAIQDRPSMSVFWWTQPPNYMVISENYMDSYDYSNFQPGLGPAAMIARRTRDQHPRTFSNSTDCQTLTKIYLRLPGSEIELRDVATNGEPDHDDGLSPFNRGRAWHSVDGSDTYFLSDTEIKDVSCGDRDWPAMNNANITYVSGYLMLKNGIRYRFVQGRPVWMRDRNGNTLTLGGPSGITDSIGRTYPSSGGFSYKGVDGTTKTVDVVGGLLETALRADIIAAGGRVRREEELFPTSAYLRGPTNSFNPSVTKAIRLPNGLEFRFFYNEYGELARIEMPAGGIVEYDYPPLGVGQSGCSYGSDSCNVHRPVKEKRLYDASNQLISRVTFEYGFSGGNPADTITTVKTFDPNGVVVRHERYTFKGNVGSDMQSTQWYRPSDNGREMSVEMLEPTTQTVLRKTDNTWKTLDLNGTPITPPEGWWTHPTNLDCALTETKTTLETNQISRQTFAYDGFGNRNDVYEYDFGTVGSGTAGALVRRNHTEYVNEPAYTSTLGSYMLDLPSKQWISSDLSGFNKVSVSDYEYDNYGSDIRHAPLVDRPNIFGHCLKLDDSGVNCLESAGTGHVIRGNLTQTTAFFDIPGNSSIQTSTQYDIAGNVLKAIDGRGYATTIEYADAFGVPDGVVHGNSAPAELSGRSAFGFPTATTNTAGHTSFVQYNYNLGVPVDSEDPNGNVTSFEYGRGNVGANNVDPLDRPSRVISAVNSSSAKTQTSYVYNDAARTITTTSDLNGFGDNLLKKEVLYDGFGRTIESRSYENSTEYIAVKQIPSVVLQDPDTGVWLQATQSSNPFRPGEQAIWTTTFADALGRVTKVRTPDNAIVRTSYSGNTVTVTDQASKSRKSVTDGLGRLIQVYEAPNDEANYNYITAYAYDALDNLKSVSQGNQTRSFAYDSLKRLTSATNPESGMICYGTVTAGQCQANGYDANGNLIRKTDARGIVTTYVYDELNRNTTVNYSNTTIGNPDVPDITRVYDNATIGANGKGRFWYSYAGGTSTTGTTVEHTAIDSYDALGRPRVQRQLFKLNGMWGDPTRTYQTERTYDLAGHVKTQKYPSNHSVTYNYDQAGRLGDKDAQNLAFTGNLGGGVPRTYSKGLVYSAMGGMTKEQFGTDTAVYNKLFYTSRGQLAEIRESTSSATDTSWELGAIINHYSDNYNCWGASCNAPDNNGNLMKQEIHIPGATMKWQQYDYDSLNRLKSVRETPNGGSAQWQQKFVYDRYGNRTIDTNVTQTYGGVNNLGFELHTEKNRLYAPGDLAISDPAQRRMQYDDGGNLKRDTYTGAGDRIYDAENRMIKAWGGSSQWQEYTYNADGQRVRRKVNGVETWQVYGMDGELLAEYAANADPLTPQKEYGYRNGQLLITATTTAAGWGTPPMLHDNPLNVAVTTVQSRHITELRTAIDGVRTHLGMAAYSWQYTAVAVGDPIKADPIAEMRTALDQALGAPSPAYATGLGQGQPIKAIHIQELRDRVLAAWQSGGSAAELRWLVTDQLGTPRMIIDNTGSLAGVKRHDYLPFGEELPAGTGGRTTTQGYVVDSVRQKFTLKERDTETNLDYFLARYYSSIQGRFTSVDPENAEAAHDFSDPQAWNGYAYVKNNPCSNTDPDGRCFCPFQRLNNFFSGYGPYSNEQLQQKEDQWRQYLRDKQKEYGTLVYTDPNTGQQSIVNPDTISRAMVFHYAASFREAEYYHRLEQYTPQQVNQMPQLAAPVINFGSQQLQKKFKHAGDFGVKGSYNPANAARYQQAVEDHLADPATKVINGTYRGQSVTHYVNSNTGLNVMKDAAGNFLSGWKLSPAQLSHVLTTGKL